MARSKVVIPKGLINLDKSITLAVEKGINDSTDDLLRVASLRAPVDSTNLEKGGSSRVDVSGSKIVGQVEFTAINKGYNYALKMDRGKYKLGKKSINKSSRGVRSKFSKVSMNVGTGYLSDTAKECEDGYTEHVNALIRRTISKAGFGK